MATNWISINPSSGYKSETVTLKVPEDYNGRLSRTLSLILESPTAENSTTDRPSRLVRQAGRGIYLSDSFTQSKSPAGDTTTITGTTNAYRIEIKVVSGPGEDLGLLPTVNSYYVNDFPEDSIANEEGHPQDPGKGAAYTFNFTLNHGKNNDTNDVTYQVQVIAYKGPNEGSGDQATSRTIDVVVAGAEKYVKWIDGANAGDIEFKRGETTKTVYVDANVDWSLRVTE